MSTPTPRTDAVRYTPWNEEQPVVSADFARTLECELATERARLDWLELHGHFGYKIGTVWSDYFAVDLAGGEKTTLRAAIDAAMNLLTRQ